MTRLCNYLIAALAAVTAVFGFGLASHADEMDDILQRGELRVAVQTQGPPVSFVDKHGNRTGLGIELVQMMADDLGVKLVIQDYDWKGLIPALQAGKVDMIAADLTPTPQRAARLLFSKPIFYGEIIAVAQSDSPYSNFEELNTAGVPMGATQSSTYSTIVKDFFPNAELKEYASTAATMQALSSGRVDGGVTDLSNARNFVKEFGNLKVLEGIITREPLAFAVQANAFHLKMWLDNYVDLITANRKLERKLHYWWETSDWEKDHK